MRMESGKTFALCAATVLVAAVLVSGQAEAATLYGWDTDGEDLYIIDTAGPSANLVGGGNPGIIAEIEDDMMSTIYASDTGDNTQLYEVNPATGQYTNAITMTFPPEGNVITSMEFVGSTLYAGLTTEGGGETYLSTIDVSSGVVTVVGMPSGVGSPLGGLAYDGSTMYAISAGGSPGELFTINLGSGMATSVGLVTIDGAPIGTTALEFGSDGFLYGLPNVNQPIPGHLLRIDRATGAAIDLGDLGVPRMVALTSPDPPGMVPAMPVRGLIAMVLLLALGTLVALRRRQSTP